MEEGAEAEASVGYVDWRGKPALGGKHGGMLAASFVLVVEIMENMAYLANASNLVTYLAGFMHFSLSRSATTVTNFMGTAFLLALLGGFLSDAFFTAYHIYLISALLEFLGLVILTVQAKIGSLKPPPGEEAAGGKAAILFAGLYLTALGVGGIKGSLAPHGGEQFDESTASGHKARSTFFNYFIFCLASGGLLAVTFVVWVEDNKGWQWGFGISTLTILLSIPVFLAGSPLYRNKVPTGSPITTIAKVLLAAISSRRSNFQSARNAVIDLEQSSPAKESKESEVRPGEELKWLNRAAEGRPLHGALSCTAHEVEDVKVVLKLLPIFLSTIMLSCCLAQLSTFSVQQAATMDTRVGALTVPPASLPIFPVIFIMALVPLYDHAIVPLARRATGSDTGITHLQRIGMGLALSVVAMAVAAAVETKRKRVARRVGEGFKGPLPITFFWVAFQYLFLGSADLFTLAGLLEFFFSEAPARMRSLATSLSWASLAMGYYLSSALVSVVNRATSSSSGGKGWLSGGSLNRYQLERFYWLMCVLSALNLANFVFWATRYRYRSGQKQ
ncbi:protein NRT1/ PTR FAMILY 4.6-like [Curcuma longa]|uniref:protein NRT1/ PTR FAMILY 4.6-like n=1 Tax=Curcuma longa TaxID=136217 RepID=UPI003D9E366E